MKLWLDAHLSPALTRWIAEEFGLEVFAVRNLGLRDALDREIFLRAREADAVVMTKDRDFSRLVAQLGSPPQVIWLRCGNTSNTYLKQMLIATLPSALALIETGEPMVEIADRS